MRWRHSAASFSRRSGPLLPSEETVCRRLSNVGDAHGGRLPWCAATRPWGTDQRSVPESNKSLTRYKQTPETPHASAAAHRSSSRASTDSLLTSLLRYSAQPCRADIEATAKQPPRRPPRGWASMVTLTLSKGDVIALLRACTRCSTTRREGSVRSRVHTTRDSRRETYEEGPYTRPPPRKGPSALFFPTVMLPLL